MNECPEWMLTFSSRVRARGNLRTFRRIRKQVKIEEEQAYYSDQPLMKDAFNVREEDSFVGQH